MFRARSDRWSGGRFGPRAAWRTLESPPVRDKNGLSRLRTVTMNITESRTGSGIRPRSPDPGPAEIDSGPGHRSGCLAAIGKMAADQDSCPGRVAGTGDRLRSWPAA
jgi:hypothetical protein